MPLVSHEIDLTGHSIGSDPEPSYGKLKATCWNLFGIIKSSFFDCFGWLFLVSEKNVPREIALHTFFRKIKTPQNKTGNYFNQTVELVQKKLGFASEIFKNTTKNYDFHFYIFDLMLSSTWGFEVFLRKTSKM